MDEVQNLQQILARIAELESRYDREPGSVRLLGVSKVQPVEKIRAVVDHGLQDIGENYFQEAQSKQSALADLNIRWHFIGHIQTNKCKEIARNFDWVHSVDRLKVAERLSKFRPTSLPPLNVCLQLNLQHEATKSGVTDDEVEEIASAVNCLPGLKLRGLMAIPEYTPDFDLQRLTFRNIRMVFECLKQKGFHLDTLSMGMTADMEAAIAEGSTMVRIGTALFGPRPTRTTVG